MFFFMKDVRDRIEKGYMKDVKDMIEKGDMIDIKDVKGFSIICFL